jgi:hypothetical protein
MKKCCFAAVCAVFVAAVLGAQEGGEARASYYVSAAGNDLNNGLSEAAAFKTLAHAVSQAAQSDTVKTVTVIGTLNEASETMSASHKEQRGTVFACFGSGDNPAEITITGKPNAADAERAALSAKGSQAGVLAVGGSLAIRFEHIEISGGERPRQHQAAGIDRRGEDTGIDMRGEGIRVTLGPGAVVRGNQGVGVNVYHAVSSCVIDGGEIRDNGGGVYVSMNCSLTLLNGTIANNKTPTNGAGVGTWGDVVMSGGSITGNSTGDTGCYFGGGVAVMSSGTFTMSGGSITGNTAGIGGGIFVYHNGVFTQTGGTISGNHAPKDAYRDFFIKERAMRIIDIR